MAPLNLLDWNERNRTFDLMAGFVPGVGGMVMNGADGTAETVSRQWVTAGFFDVLGVTADCRPHVSSRRRQPARRMSWS